MFPASWVNSSVGFVNSLVSVAIVGIDEDGVNSISLSSSVSMPAVVQFSSIISVLNTTLSMFSNFTCCNVLGRFNISKLVQLLISRIVLLPAITSSKLVKF